MIALHLKAALDPDDLSSVLAALEGRAYASGKKTAAVLARQAKHNEELLASSDPTLATAGRLVETGLRKNPYFQAWTLPRRVSTVLFSRYDAGMFYADHVDNALAESTQAGFLRMDLAFTVFLSDPASYQGGELVINSTTESQAIKLPAGDAVVYSAASIHRVNKVLHGTRCAAVGWVESLVRDQGQRNLLFDLRVLAEQLHAQRTDPEQGEGTLVLLEKCRANLLRMWVDV